MTKRLFILAAYNKNNVIPETLLDYVKCLNSIEGKNNIAVVIDSDIPETELNKLKPLENMVYIDAHRHGEYDFGSYKRGYNWARDKKLLDKYDWVYFLNDSVFCLHAPSAVLSNLESRDAEFIGMATTNENGKAPHFQSWFFGVSSRIVQQQWFNAFMSGIERTSSKEEIIMRYEVGLSALMRRHGITFASLDDGTNNKISTYKHPIQLLNIGCPFIKKTAIPYIHKFNRLMPHIDDICYLNHIITESCANGIQPNAHHKQEKCIFKLFGIKLFTITCNARGTTHNFNLFGRIRIAQYKRIPD